jgi:hypothetical protein
MGYALLLSRANMLSMSISADIYVHNTAPFGVWVGTVPRLFAVKQATNQNRAIVETVTDVVGGLWRRSV